MILLQPMKQNKCTYSRPSILITSEMPGKKKATSKAEVVATPSREMSNTDFGYAITGNIELDFVEGRVRKT